MARPTIAKTSYALLTLAATVILIAGLHFASDVLIPLALAILLCFLLAPIVSRLERWGVWRVASVLLVVVLAFAATGGIGLIVGNQIVDLAQNVSLYKDNIHKRLAILRRPTGTSALGRAVEGIKDISREITPAAASQPTTRAATPAPTPTDNEPPDRLTAATPVAPVPVQIVDPPAAPMQVIGNLLGSVIGPLGTAGLVVIFVIFMLLYREDLRDRLIRLIGRGELNVTTQAIDDATTRVSRYLLMQSTVNGSYGLAVAVGLFFIGVPSFALWGLLTAVLRFIPYLGPWLGAAMPMALSLAVFDDWLHPIATAGLFIVIELISNNVIEPWLYGASTGVSPVAILVAAVFWTWLWGGVGLVLSTPLTVCVAVLGKYIPQLAFLDVLLGDEPVLTPPARYYQRMLSLDADEASDVVDEQLESKSLLDVYDQVILPAVRMAERARHAGKLDDEHQAFVLRTSTELVAELGERYKVSGEDQIAQCGDETPGAHSPASVIVLPARDDADELAARMLTQVLRQADLQARYLPAATLAGEMVDRVAQCQAGIVAISAMPPDAMMHARYLCKRLTARLPEVKLIVGIWSAPSVDTKQAARRLRCRTSDAVALSLADTLAQIQQLMQPLLIKAGELPSGQKPLKSPVPQLSRPAEPLSPSSLPRRP